MDIDSSARPGTPPWKQVLTTLLAIAFVGSLLGNIRFCQFKEETEQSKVETQRVLDISTVEPIQVFFPVLDYLDSIGEMEFMRRMLDRVSGPDSPFAELIDQSLTREGRELINMAAVLHGFEEDLIGFGIRELQAAADRRK